MFSQKFVVAGHQFQQAQKTAWVSGLIEALSVTSKCNALSPTVDYCLPDALQDAAVNWVQMFAAFFLSSSMQCGSRCWTLDCLQKFLYQLQ